MEHITLSNGVDMPLVGFGVFQVDDLATCEKTVLDAISCGYRMIDTAASYKNEEAVGAAIAKSGVPREDLFVVTKAYIHQMGYEKTRVAFEESCAKLGVDYLDLYLVHMPFGDYYGAWRAMEELYREGRVRAIGVSNFASDRLVDLCRNFAVAPASPTSTGSPRRIPGPSRSRRRWCRARLPCKAQPPWPRTQACT